MLPWGMPKQGVVDGIEVSDAAAISVAYATDALAVATADFGVAVKDASRMLLVFFFDHHTKRVDFSCPAWAHVWERVK